MQPWQVSLGLSIVILVPGGVFVSYELGYLTGYWGLVMDLYGYHVVVSVASVYLLTVFGVYQLARSLSLGDVGSRISVLDRTIREGRAGDAELSEALRREAAEDYES